MKHSLLLLLLGFVPAALWSNGFTTAHFYPLHSLEGIWKSERSSGTLFEVWQKQNDSTMYGYSFQVKNNDTVYLEKVWLTYRNGNIVYQPTTMNQNKQQPVDFTLSKISSASYQFENKQHDFPQIINYEIRNADSLYASISGPTTNGNKVIHFNYVRIK